MLPPRPNFAWRNAVRVATSVVTLSVAIWKIKGAPEKGPTESKNGSIAAAQMYLKYSSTCRRFPLPATSSSLPFVSLQTGPSIASLFEDCVMSRHSRRPPSKSSKYPLATVSPVFFNVVVLAPSVCSSTLTAPDSKMLPRLALYSSADSSLIPIGTTNLNGVLNLTKDPARTVRSEKIVPSILALVVAGEIEMIIASTQLRSAAASPFKVPLQAT